MSDNSTSLETKMIVKQEAEESKSENSKFLQTNVTVNEEPDGTLLTIKKEENEEKCYEYEENDHHPKETFCKETRNWIDPEDVKQERSYIPENGTEYQQSPLYISNYDIKNIKEEPLLADSIKKELKELTPEDTKYPIDIIEHKVQLDDTSNITETSKNAKSRVHLPTAIPKVGVYTKRKKCAQCALEKKRRDTVFYCPDCPLTPGLCIKCFRVYHNY